MTALGKCGFITSNPKMLEIESLSLSFPSSTKVMSAAVATLLEREAARNIVAFYIGLTPSLNPKLP
jgi:predicted alpha/beta-fold hydrolase